MEVKPEGVTVMVGTTGVEETGVDETGVDETGVETLDGLMVIEEDSERYPQAGAHGGGWKR